MFFIGYGMLLLASIFKLNRTFHMLQQNSYMVRYLKWSSTAPRASYCTSLVIISMVAVLGIWNIWYNIPFVICSLIVLFFSWLLNKARQETAIKPLVYTKRVKRMYITASVVLVALFVLSAKSRSHRTNSLPTRGLESAPKQNSKLRSCVP